MYETGVSARSLRTRHEVFNIFSPDNHVMDKEKAVTFLTECGREGSDILKQLNTESFSKFQYFSLEFKNRGKLNNFQHFTVILIGG